MDKKIEMSLFLNIADMDNAIASTQEKPIIGVQALATCFGLLLYDEKQKLGIIAHFSTEINGTFLQILNLIDFGKNNLFKYVIIPGYYSKIQDPYMTRFRIEKVLKSIQSDQLRFIPFDDIPSNAVSKSKSTPSYQFAFDTRIGKFVTDKVLFGIEYIDNVLKLK